MATVTITRLDPEITNAAAIRFEVEFSTDISRVIDDSWFDLVTFGTIRNADITSVARVSNPGGGTKVVVTVATGTGDGSINVNLHGYEFGTAVSTTSTQQFPRSAVLQDLGGDGRLDLVFVNAGTDRVSVLQGNGDGTFGNRINYPVGDRPNSVAVGDINHDGRPDLIVANSLDNTISVLRGIGSGIFSDADDIELFFRDDLVRPHLVALADVNGDTHLDIIASTSTVELPSGEVEYGLTVVLGQGDGSFTQGATYGADAGYSPPTGADQMLTGDFDRDGRTDVLLMSETFFSGLAVGQIHVLMGQADGSFSAEGRLAIPTSNGARAVAIGDFTGDGRLDFVAAWGDSIVLQAGRGDGSFGNASFVYGNTARTLTAADVDGDGSLDIIAGVSLGDGRGAVLILLNDGVGRFTTDGRLTVTASAPLSVVAGRLDGDGGTDIVTTDQMNGGYSVLLNEVTPRGGPAYTLDRTPPTLAITSAGGLTNQPTQTVSGTADATTATSISIYEGAVLRGTATVGAGGAWSTNVTLSGQGGHTLVAKAADALGNQGTSNGVFFTLDTVTPLVGITSPGGPINSTQQVVAGTLGTGDAGRTVSILEGTTVLGTGIAAADGSWSISVALDGEGPHQLIARATDLAGNTGTSSAISFDVDLTRPRLLAIERADPAALDAPFVNYVIRFSEAVEGLDIGHVGLATTGAQAGASIVSISALPNGTDYAVRIATAPGDGTIALRVDGLGIEDLAGNALPGGSFEAARFTPLPSTEINFLAAADLDGDGDLDVVAPTSNPASRATILLNQGDGSFVAQSPTTITALRTFGLALADVTGDGELDLLTLGDLGLAIARGNGDGTFTNTVGSGVTFNERRTFAVGHMNGDAYLDIVYSQQTQSVVLLNNGNGTFTPGATITGSYAVRAIADVNRDGKGDAVSVFSGSIVIGFGDGAGGFTSMLTLPTGSTDSFNESLAIGDLDGDGWVDLVTGHQSGVSVLRGLGNGQFAAAQPYIIGAGQLVRYAIELADLDINGDLDVVAAGATNTAVLMGRGDGTLAAAQLYAPIPFRTGLVVGDATGDGSLDLLIAATNGMALLPSRPAITTGPAYTIDRSLDAAPVAKDDAYTAVAGQVLTVGAGRGVLTNDADVDSTGLAAVLLAQPMHGSVTLLANGRFDYRPDAGFIGFDSFTYRASAGGAFSAPAVVAIAVASAGDDLLVGTSRDDRADGMAGHDSLVGAAGADSLLGGAGNDRLRGDAGADTLVGGPGADTLNGSDGNDLLVIEDAADQAFDSAGADTLRSFVDTTLPTGVEALELLGAGRNGTGNAADNRILGNALANLLNGSSGNDLLLGQNGNDTLNGGAGADSLAGGLGADRYSVDEAGDTVLEEDGGGSDIVAATRSWTLGDHVEALVLGGSGDFSGIGNTLANRLTGNAGRNLLLGYGGNDNLVGGGGADTLDGGIGRDRLTAGAGADWFFFVQPSEGVDVVADFTEGEDAIVLRAPGFIGLEIGALGAAQFVAHTSNAATAPAGTAQVIYNTATGALFFDFDGAGATALIRFATLAGAPALSAGDVFIV